MIIIIVKIIIIKITIIVKIIIIKITIIVKIIIKMNVRMSATILSMLVFYYLVKFLPFNNKNNNKNISINKNKNKK